MQDLEIAKRRIEENNLTLSIVKDGKVIFEAVSHGISGFLEAVEKFGDRLENASVADRVVGKAIALLCVYAKVNAVCAIILSKTAKAVLEENMIHNEWNELVDNILNCNKNELCPFEKLATKILDPNEAFIKLKALQSSLRTSDEGEMSSEHEQFISKKDAELKRIGEKKLKKLMESKGEQKK